MQKLCTQCFYIGKEESHSFSDLKTESILWGTAFFFSLAGAFETFLWFPATIIFFIALLYSISGYTFKACVCSKCHSNSMIPVKSEKAQQIINERGLMAPGYTTDKYEPTILGIALKSIFIVLTVVLVLYMLFDHFS